MMLVYINISKLVLTLQYAYPNFLFFIQIIFPFFYNSMKHSIITLNKNVGFLTKLPQSLISLMIKA